MAKAKPKLGQVFRSQGTGFEVVESFGSNPPTADSDETIVAIADEQMEAAGGDCPIITFFNPDTKLGAVVHLNAEHRLDQHHVTMIEELIAEFTIAKSSSVHVILDLKGLGKPVEEREPWLDKILAFLGSKGFTDVVAVTKGEGKYVTLNGQQGLLIVQDNDWETIVEYSYE